MKLTTGLLLVALVGASIVPEATALGLDPALDVDLGSPVGVRTNTAQTLGKNISIEAQPELGPTLRGDPGIDVETPVAATAQDADPMVSILGPETRHAAGAAVGTVVGIAILAGLWNYFKYGMLAGIGGPLFSRIASHKILDNDVRNRVHECIATTPGVTIKEITQLLGIGWGTAVYHLERLEKERLIVSERHRQFRRYFKNGGGIVNDDKTAFAELKNPTTQRIASEILHRPGAAQKDLCETVGISAPLAHKHLARLEGAQLLTKQREWKTVKYFPTSKLQELLPNQAAVPVLAA